jgi:DNA (cytosine-5)-methyltransferase 1
MEEEMSTRQNKKESPTVVDLFCGAGGLSLGLLESGLTPIHAVDLFRAAVETYEANIGDHVVCDEIDENSSFPDSNVIAGGPPCQGFSSAGKRRTGDPRNSLVGVFANLIASHRPDAFVFENVEGFLTMENGSRVIELLDPLIEAGYHIHLRKVNAANFGVPQHRKRVVAIGGLGWEPNFPPSTRFAYGAPGASLVGHNLPPTPSVMDWLADLPAASESRESAIVSDHYCKPLSGLDLERASLLKPGQRMRDLPESLQHASFAKRANRRVKDGTPTERRGGAPSGVRRLLPHEPSKAITSAARTEFIHPVEDRTLTLRECAKLQTFPDDFEFHGTLCERSTLIGNAVPMLLAQSIGASLMDDLRDSKYEESTGRLVSFVPTESSGMSPALRATTDAVTKRYGLANLQVQQTLW